MVADVGVDEEDDAEGVGFWGRWRSSRFTSS